MSLTFCSVRNDRTSDVCETFSLRPEVVRCTVPDRTLRCHGKIIDDESYVLLREKRSYLRCVWDVFSLRPEVVNSVRFRIELCDVMERFNRFQWRLQNSPQVFSRRDRNSLWHVVVLESSLQSRSVSTAWILLWKWSWRYSNPLVKVTVAVFKSSCERRRDGTRILFWTWS